MDNIFPQNSGAVAKSYWNQASGKLGIILGLGILGMIGWFLLPIFTTIIWNTINFGIACGVAFALYMFFFTNNKLKLFFYYMYKAGIKKLYGIVYETDPFIIADDYIEDIEKERETLSNKSIEVDTQKEAIEAKIKEKQADKEHQLNIADAARIKGDGMGMANATRQVSRLENYIQQLTPIKDNLTKISTYLDQVYKNSKYMLDDMKNDIELKKDLYKSVTKGNNALKSALSIFQGNPDKKQMLDQSMDYLKDDMANKLASMKKAISYSSDFMRSIDLENASYETQGLKMLEASRPDEFTYNKEGGQPLSIPQAPANNYDNLLN